LIACKGEPAADLPVLDLLPHGMPIVIKAPSDAEVRTMDLVLMKDLTVVHGEDFNVQIFESEATTRDVSVILARLTAEVKNNPYFYNILKTEPAGFVYENRVDSSYINYGFRHVRIQGDKEYVFQQGLRGKFSLADVETMYAAVK
jgi:hypothetical protein